MMSKSGFDHGILPKQESRLSRLAFNSPTLGGMRTG